MESIEDLESQSSPEGLDQGEQQPFKLDPLLKAIRDDDLAAFVEELDAIQQDFLRLPESETNSEGKVLTLDLLLQHLSPSFRGYFTNDLRDENDNGILYYLLHSPNPIYFELLASTSYIRDLTERTYSGSYSFEDLTPINYLIQNGNLPMVKAALPFIRMSGGTSFTGSKVDLALPELIHLWKGFSLFHIALTAPVEVRHAMIDVILDNGYEIDDEYWAEYPVLIYACQLGQVDDVKYLIQKGADWMTTSQIGQSIFVAAAFSGSIELCDYIYSLNPKDENGNVVEEYFGLTRESSNNDCPLSAAIQYCQVELVQHFITKYNVDMSFRASSGHTLLHHVGFFETPRSLEICEFIYPLVIKHHDIDLTDDDGDSALFCAMETNNVVAFNFLLEHKANFNRIRHDGGNILHFAGSHARFGFDCFDIVFALEDAKFDVNLENQEGLRPIDTALMNDTPHVFERLITHKDIDVSNVFNKSTEFMTAERTVTLEPGSTMLTFAIAVGANSSCVEALMKKGNFNPITGARGPVIQVDDKDYTNNNNGPENEAIGKNEVGENTTDDAAVDNSASNDVTLIPPYLYAMKCNSGDSLRGMILYNDGQYKEEFLATNPFFTAVELEATDCYDFLYYDCRLSFFNMVNDQGQSPFLYAGCQNDRESISQFAFLMRKYRLKWHNYLDKETGESIIHKLIQYPNIECETFESIAIRSYAIFDVPNNNGYPPILLLAQSTDPTYFAAFLKIGIHIGATTTTTKENVFHILLRTHGNNVDKLKEYVSVLQQHWSAEASNIKYVKELLHHEPDIDGVTPMSIIESNGLKEIFDPLLNVEETNQDDE
jgi:ankyrin repeat protein